MCLWIYQGGRCPLSLELPLIYRTEDSSLIIYTTIIFREISEHCYLGTLQKTWLKIFCYQKQYRHSLRTVGDSLKEHNSSSPHFTYLLSFNFSIIINVYILIIRHVLCQTYVCMVLERTSYKL